MQMIVIKNANDRNMLILNIFLQFLQFTSFDQFKQNQ